MLVIVPLCGQPVASFVAVFTGLADVYERVHYRFLTSTIMVLISLKLVPKKTMVFLSFIGDRVDII